MVAMVGTSRGSFPTPTGTVEDIEDLKAYRTARSAFCKLNIEE